MEEIRRRMMQDTSLYPNPRKTNQNREESPISIASSSTSTSEAPATKPRKARPIVISSDEEDESPAPVKMPVPNPAPAPLNTRPPNFPGTYPNPTPQMRMPVPMPAPAPAPRVAQPIHVPSNRDLYHQIPKPQAQAPAPNWETFTLPEEANLYDPRTSAAEAEKALRELVEESHNDKPEGEELIDMSLSIVDGFREDVRLLPHQVLGRVWMGERESGKKLGGILADDMGLGKTIQTLTRIVDGRPRKSDKADGWAAGTLVVCPVSLVSQWASEIQKMAVGLKVIEHHGPSRASDPAKLKMAHVVVTSYSIVASEHGTYQSSAKDETTKSKKKGKGKVSSDSDSDDDDDDSDSEKNFGKTVLGKKKAPKYASAKKAGKDALFRIKWWRIVLDEAHNIKNRTTKAALACCDLEGKYRWCLTGTPMQNNVEELYSLIKFLQIRPLNDWATFNEQIAKPVKAGRQVRAMKRLHVVLKAIMLRRRKDHILNGKPVISLPARTVNIVKCEFDEDEREFYKGLEGKMKTEVDRLVELGTVEKSYTSVLTMLLRLRQACNHPSLVTKDLKTDKDAIEPKAASSKGGDSDDEADDLADMFGGLGVSSGKKCEVCQSVMPAGQKGTQCQECHNLTGLARRKSMARPGSDLPPDSAKIREILRLLREVDDRRSADEDDEEGEDAGEKTIIFSQFTSMLDLIQPFLREEGIKHVRYDGKMAKDKREMSLAQIRESRSIRVILISFKAGSTGLNLTSCNNVILVDLWWNPALEEQAFDRAHRFGQKRDVNIYKLTIEDTVEDRILTLQETKRELTKAALSGDKMKNNKLGINDLMALFRSGGRDDEEDE